MGMAINNNQAASGIIRRHLISRHKRGHEKGMRQARRKMRKNSGS